MELTSLLQSLAERLGMDSLALNENGVLSLQFDGTITVHVEPDPESGVCHLYSTLCRVPEEATPKLAIYEAVLSANCFGRGTSGAAFSLETGTQEILLGRQFAPEDTEPEDLFGWLQDLVTVVDTWQKRLPEIAGDAILPPAEPFEGPMHFIRA